jgi:hypothetical protein
VENRDHFVSKDDLIASVWGGRIVFDSTLTNRINAARRAAGDSGDEQKLIRTIASDQVDALGLIRQMLDRMVAGRVPDPRSDWDDEQWGLMPNARI